MNEYLKRNYEGSTNRAEVDLFRKYLRRGIHLLTARQQKVMKMYYVDFMNEPQIANELIITQQGVSKILRAYP